MNTALWFRETRVATLALLTFTALSRWSSPTLFADTPMLVYLDPHLIRQATKRYVERCNAFCPNCPVPTVDCRKQPITSRCCRRRVVQQKSLDHLTNARVSPSMVRGIEPLQLMVNAKELPAVEFVDYTFVFH